MHPELPQPRVLMEALGRPLRSVIAAPLWLGGDRLGVVVAARLGGAAFAQPDLELLEEVAEPLLALYRRSLGPGEGPDEEERLRHLQALTGCEGVDLSQVIPDPSLLEAIGRQTLLRYRVLPLRDLGEGRIMAAISDPLDWRNLDDFESVSGFRITERRLATAAQVVHCLEAGFEELDAARARRAEPERDLLMRLSEDLRGIYAAAEESAEGEVDEDSPPVVQLASQLVRDAYTAGASDIHIEVRETRLVVRFRIDGTLRDRLVLPIHVARPLVARIKIMSDLNIAERRLPQDGRLHFARFEPAVDIDLRVSVMPMHHGECVVMRLLDRHGSGLELSQLGFSPYNLERYRQAVRSPFGMILHCGPTGSGKSTTLHAALKEINDPQWKIVAAEDPIEYTLDGVSQLQVKPQIGLSFAAALRCFMRHDPDVILVGEIRDAETARVAVEASLTGHLLLSTLHTNDAATSVARLDRLGVEPLLLGSTLLAVCAQRLVRRVCGCAKRREPGAEDLALLRCARDMAPPEQIAFVSGCEACHHTGFRGRIGIHELMLVSDRLREQIAAGASAHAIKSAARAQGMRTLFEDAMAKVNGGATSLDEALRVSRPDEMS